MAFDFNVACLTDALGWLDTAFGAAAGSFRLVGVAAGTNGPVEPQEPPSIGRRRRWWLG